MFGDLSAYELQQIYKKFIMFLENLSAHRLPECPSTSSPEGDVILVYLPKYTPQLNPMEIQWMVLKNMLVQRSFRNVEELAKSIRILVGACHLRPIRQMDYMIL